MTYITDTQVEQSCATLRKAVNAAENSNHAGEVFVVAAANATALVEALEGMRAAYLEKNGCYPLPYQRDGHYVEMQAADAALTLAKGGRV